MAVSSRRATVSSRASANATAAATSGVPARRPRSCPPPSISATIFTPSRTTNTPMPRGPPTLCPVTVTRSQSMNSLGSIHIGACTASVCRTALGERSRTRLKTSLKGWRVPISLLTAITETNAVCSSRSALRRSMSMMPSDVTGANATRAPSAARRAAGAIIALCSISETTTPDKSLGASASPRTPRITPLTARLSDSVPPPVNTTSWGRHPSRVAIRSRASSRAVFAARAEECIPVGLAWSSSKVSCITETTSG
ncbi:unannotated protein [freshwater metagenome]|uniref:Unannotated protein n=1 Tax=freshwater metagenome TaxID=449393 RepID=A0A6J7R0D3_9ZZZZ